MRHSYTDHIMKMVDLMIAAEFGPLALFLPHQAERNLRARQAVECPSLRSSPGAAPARQVSSRTGRGLVAARRPLRMMVEISQIFARLAQTGWWPSAMATWFHSSIFAKSMLLSSLAVVECRWCSTS
jgi:hypothetical protein